MTFESVETSVYGNDPIELYAFNVSGTVFRYSSGDEDILFQSHTYTAATVQRGRIEATPDLGKNNIKINVPRTLPFVTLFLASPPTTVVELTITRIHASDQDPAITWIGRVVNVSFKDNVAEITASPLSSSLKRPGLRRPYQLDCAHVLYEINSCRVIQDSFLIPATLTAVSGNIITSTGFIVSINPTFDATWFVGGIVESTTGTLVTRRFVTEHNNATGELTLNLPFEGILAGDTVTAFPGCDRRIATCDGKFANLPNHGGFPYIPEKNPMDGTSVF